MVSRKTPAGVAGQMQLRTVLSAIAAELSVAQRSALELQRSIGEVIARLGDEPCDALYDLQRVDHLSQSLGDLTSCLAELAPLVPEACEVDIAAARRRLRLRGLAERLAPCGNTTERTDPDDDNLHLL